MSWRLAAAAPPRLTVVTPLFRVIVNVKSDRRKKVRANDKQNAAFSVVEINNNIAPNAFNLC